MTKAIFRKRNIAVLLTASRPPAVAAYQAAPASADRAVPSWTTSA
jgi:hypothetical protein